MAAVARGGLAFAAAALISALFACPRSPPRELFRDAERPLIRDAVPRIDASDAPVPQPDARIGHDAAPPISLATKEELRALVQAALLLDAGSLSRIALFSIAPEPGRFNQGNRALAEHAIARETCEAGLGGTTLQTVEQRRVCRDHPNMVPIYRGGDAGAARACIDVFEFPNQACELPFVWGTPVAADQLCRAEGKRLCTQDEWSLACAGDPEGGADRIYAYGDALDLTVCNTNKPHPFGPDGQTWLCSARTAETAWSTCATETEPSGAFPANAAWLACAAIAHNLLRAAGSLASFSAPSSLTTIAIASNSTDGVPDRAPSPG